MTNSRPFTLFAAAIFLVMALVHAYRLVTHFQIIIGSHPIPLNASWVGLAIALVLAWMLFKESRR
jgi:hypothetical protein